MKLKRSGKRVVRIVLKNSGGAVATGVRVCAAGTRAAKPVRRCVSAGRIRPGKRKTVKLGLRGRKRGAATVRLTVRSGNAGKAKGRLRVRTR